MSLMARRAVKFRIAHCATGPDIARLMATLAIICHCPCETANATIPAIIVFAFRFVMPCIPIRDVICFVFALVKADCTFYKWCALLTH